MRPIDAGLGAFLGLAAGALFRPIFERAWKWGFARLGPTRPSELNPRAGDVPPRTAVRDLLAAACAAAALGASWLVLTLPFKSLVAVWGDFLLVWGIGFLVAALVIAARPRKDAT